MSRGGTKLRWWDGAQHGLDETSVLSCWHGVCPCSRVVGKPNMTLAATQNWANRCPAMGPRCTGSAY